MADLQYEDLITATFCNNLSFVSDWLSSCPGDQVENADKTAEHQKWMGDLLSASARHHSVDVARCIIDHIASQNNCQGDLTHGSICIFLSVASYTIRRRRILSSALVWPCIFFAAGVFLHAHIKLLSSYINGSFNKDRGDSRVSEYACIT